MEKEYGLLPPQRKEIEVITERINKKYSQMKHQSEVEAFISRQRQKEAERYNSPTSRPSQSFDGYLHDNYIKKEAHFPLSEPKTIYISKENHKEVSLERIKELFNSKK